MRFLRKLQGLSLGTRKIILWLIVVIIGVSLFFLWLKNIQKELGNFQSQGLIEELSLPKIEMPEIKGYEK